MVRWVGAWVGRWIDEWVGAWMDGWMESGCSREWMNGRYGEWLVDGEMK